ncbi:MAG: hypothetical protein ACXWJI_09840 [Caldimonas sp.]
MNPTSTTQVRAGRSARTVFALAGATALLLAAGCASLPPPADLDLRGARIAPIAGVPALDVNGLPGGKATGAVVGAGTGSGVGVVSGVLACLSTGPFFPLCIATLVPAGAAIGAATGAVVGGVRTESIDAIATKTRVLNDELVAVSYHELLARRLQEQLRDENDVEVALATPLPAMPAADSAGPVAVDPPWTLEVGVVEVGTEGKGTFAMRLVTRLALRHSGAAPVWETRKEVQSETELTTGQWIADDSKALRGVLDLCLRQAASQLAIDLGAGRFASPPARTRLPARYSTSCGDVPARWEGPAS